MSDESSVSIGVPQGSLLGPTLFSVCLNDLVHPCREADLLLYTDDTSCVISDRSLVSAACEPNSELSRINACFFFM